MKLRSYLIRTVLAAVIPVGVLAGLLVFGLARNERAAHERTLASVAQAMAVALDSEVQRSITALQVLALSPAIDDEDLAAFRPQAEVAARLHGGWSNLVLARADGSRLFNLRVPAGKPVPRSGDDGPLAAAVERRPIVSNASVSGTSGKPTAFVTVPVLRGDGAPWVLSASIEYDVWTDWLRRQIPADALAGAIDDRNGVILARSARPEAFVGKPASETFLAAYKQQSRGVVHTRNIEGAAIYAAFDTSEQTGWHTVLVMPAAAVEAGATRVALGLAVATALVLVLSVALALWMARPVSRDIGRLAQVIGRVGGGQAPAWAASRVDEIDDAGRAAAQAGELLSARAAHVSQLSAELAERARTAEHASRMKDQFLGMLGHELRNPLGAISNAAAVLQRRIAGADDRRLVEIVERQTRHLSTLVNDLLDVSRAVAGKLHVQRRAIDLRTVVVGQLDALRAAGALARHQVTLSAQAAPVLGDPDRLAQVVRNLVENALKYTPEGGRVAVTLERGGSDAVLCVADSGRGIDPELLGQVFEPFIQAPQTPARRTGGLGLGLSIVRQIMALHGGSVQAHSTGSGQGAQFTVRMPLADAAAAETPRGPAATPAARPLRVALVEDHDDARLGLRRLLEAEGHRVSEAVDGAAGLALLCREPFDAALVDIGLPELSGLELARDARRAGVGCRLIAVSGYGQADDRARAVGAGFDAFLVKPASAAELAAALAPAANAELESPLQSG